MNNIDGALAFEASLNIDDFNVSTQAMERSIRNTSNTAISESERMEDSIMNFAKNGAKYITTYLIGQGMGNLLQTIVTTRGQFQQLEIAFETMLGSASKARELMAQTANTVATTPFDLLGVASGIKQLLAYGEASDTVNDTLVRLGNIASGLSIPLNDIVYLYGTTMTQGRLFTQDVRQFMGRGIPLVKELATELGKTEEEINAMVTAGKIGFPEVQKVIEKMTNSGGQFYNLMEKQSKSLTGLMSNLGDAWDSQMNAIGESSQDALVAGISGAIDLVNNMDKILTIIKAVSIAYGSYKAAILLNTIATKGLTGVMLINNTVDQAKIALTKLDAKITGEAAAQTEAMTTAQEAQVKSLLKQLSAEQQVNLAKKLRVSAIDQLLTAQQKEHLSFLNITTASKEYEAEALKIMSVEQKEALSKTDLSSKSGIYRAALKQEVAAKSLNLEVMRADVKASAAQIKNYTAAVEQSTKATEAARWEVQIAKKSGDAIKIAAAEKKLETTITEQATIRKTREAAITEFNTKKKNLETLAIKQSTLASVADTTAKTTQSTVTSIFTAVTTKATLAVKSLWLAIKANPLGWIVSMVGLAISAFTLFSKKTDEATTVEGEFQEATRKSSEELRTFMSILQNSESGTSTHRMALEKINAICKEYNKTLLTENATLEDQKTKYEELRAAIQATTAEKLKAKYIEAAMVEQAEAEADALEDLQKRAQKATYNTGRMQYTPSVMGGGVASPVYEQSGSIRGASNAVWEAVISDAKDAAEELKNLSGSEYDDALELMLNKTLVKIQGATKATTAEIDNFAPFVSQAFNQVIEKSIETRGVVDKTTNSMNQWYAIDQTPNVAESVDYAAMSFSELDKLLIETQSEIDKLNSTEITLDTDKSNLSDLYTTLKQINSAITEKTTNLNTEAGISGRVKQLKEERENVEINSDRYKELSATITTLEKRVPSTKNDKSDEDAIKKAEQAAEKQRQAQVKAEQSRIEVMEDGFEKRKALLDFQHQQELYAIEEERKELEKARKEAGYSGLSDYDQQNYDDRVQSENTTYTKAQNNLFDGEMEYKKTQYELYFKWVRNMGEDVANTQFSTLLKSGTSYKDYVERQIQELKTKQTSGTLTEGESNYLIALNMQYDEITGAKTAMDAFKESLTQAISEAATLAEKIKIVADAKERLSNGSTGLIGADENAAANLFVLEQEKELDAELKKTIVSAGFLSDVFTKAQDQSTKSLKKIIADIQAVMDYINGKSDVELPINISAEDVAKIAKNADQMQSIIEELYNKQEELDSRSNYPLSGFVKGFKYLKEAAELSEDALDANDQKQKALILKQAQLAKTKGMNYIASGAATAATAVSSLAETFNELAEATGDEQLSEVADQMSAVAQNVSAAAQGFASGGWIGAIVGGVTDILSQTISAFTTAKAEAAEFEQNRLDFLDAYQLKLLELEEDDYASEFGERTFEKTMAAMEKATEALAKYKAEVDSSYVDTVDSFGGFATLLLSSTTAYKEAYTDLQAMSVKTTDYSGWANFWGKSDKYTSLKDLAPELWDESGEFNIDAAEAFLDTNTQISDEQRTQIQNVIDLYDAYEENLAIVESAISDTFGYLGESATDALVSAISTGADSWELFKEAGSDAIEALGEQLMYELYLASAFEQLQSDLTNSYTAGSAEDIANMQAELLDNFFDNITDEMEAAQAFGEQWKEKAAASGYDIWNDDSDDDSLSGAVSSLSEDTGGVIAGRLNAVIISQSEQLEITRGALIYQAQIAANTKLSAERLTSIESTLKTISQKSLLPYGLY